jgi:DNA end-binding protein Ku
MVSIPVELFSAIQEKDVHFHQLHRPCGSRVRLQKYCPVHEMVVPDDEIVKGYEVSKGRYVFIEDEDLEGLPVASQHTVNVTAFVKAEEVDPIYFDRSYYLRPEETGQKPFALLAKAMVERKVSAIAQIAMRSRESLCLIRPAGDTMLLETLFYPDEIRKTDTISVSSVKVEEKELKMALSLVDLLEQKFDPAEYHDAYREELLHRIEQKAQGQKVEPTEEIEQPSGEVIDLMSALKKSVEAAKAARKTS